MSFFRGYWIKATRKPHRCWWCDKLIEAGSAAYYAAGIGYESNEFSDGHAHPECQAAIDSIPHDELLEGWYPGEHARGRADDDFKAPPQFSPDYRGRQSSETRTGIADADTNTSSPRVEASSGSNAPQRPNLS